MEPGRALKIPRKPVETDGRRGLRLKSWGLNSTRSDIGFATSPSEGHKGFKGLLLPL